MESKRTEGATLATFECIQSGKRRTVITYLSLTHTHKHKQTDTQPQTDRHTSKHNEKLMVMLLAPKDVPVFS